MGRWRPGTWTNIRINCKHFNAYTRAVESFFSIALCFCLSSDFHYFFFFLLFYFPISVWKCRTWISLIACTVEYFINRNVITINNNLWFSKYCWRLIEFMMADDVGIKIEMGKWLNTNFMVEFLFGNERVNLINQLTVYHGVFRAI